MNELALFAGAGGGLLASKILGWRTVAAVEASPFRRCAIMQRQNDGVLDPFPIWDDVRTFDGEPFSGLVDVVSGGFPCQRFSAAARGRQNAPDLWPEMQRVVGEVKPAFVFTENVDRRVIDRAGDDLESMGYDTAAIFLGARHVGADHIRDHYWLVAHSHAHRELHGPVHGPLAELPGVQAGVWRDGPPGAGRMVDGVAHRMDRLEAIGDGQVPLVAAAAFVILVRHLRERGNA